MSLFKCKMCGGDLEIAEGVTIAECEYCGTKQTVPKAMDENLQNLFNRATTLRIKSEFDKAEKMYEKIIQADTTQSEAYWGLILCKYGIEYVDDPATYKKIPTCHRASYDSIIADDDYKSALEYADMSQRALYEEQAKEIDRIQKEILALAQKEETYDVFICYKETDSNGKRTQDSVIANDIYYQLTQEGFKVFYAAITLEGKLGSAYEPIIFAALNSAKVMLSIGTKPEYFNAVWVKNEWSRFLKIIQKDRSKLLIPCYRDMDAYELPEEFAHLQAQDMAKIGFINDVVRGIKKVIKKDEPKATTVVKETVVTSANANVAPLLKRAFMFLEDGDWERADDFCEQVLNQDPENAQAYLGKLMAELRVRKRDELKNCSSPFDDRNDYQKAIRFGDEAMKKELRETVQYIKERNEQERLLGLYNSAVSAMNAAKTEEAYKKAAEQFAEISKYKDSAELRKKCLEKAETSRLEAIYKSAVGVMSSAKSEHAYKQASSQFAKISQYKDAEKLKVECLEKAEVCRKDAIYDAAVALVRGSQKPSDYNSAIKMLEKIPDWRDATELIEKYNRAINNLAREAEEARIAAAMRAKRNKKIFMIASPIVCMVVVFVILLNAVIIPNGKYNDAIALMNSGKYVEAITAFEAMKGYKNSELKIAECNTAILDSKYNDAVVLMNNQKYLEAISAFEALNGHRDSAQKIADCNTAILDGKYNDAIALMNAKKYTEAISAFEAINGHRDSAQKIADCNTAILDGKYNDAVAFMNAKKYTEAISAFEALNGHKDSAQKIADCNTAILNGKYDDAVALMNAKKYTEAISAFEALNGHKDSAQKIADCNTAIWDGKYNDAVALMNAEKYTEAISAFEALNGHRDSAQKIADCNTAILDGKYNDAVALMNTGDIIKAYEALRALDGYRDSAEKADSIYVKYEIENVKSAKVGDYIQFGSYEQDNILSNGKEKIEWLVLDIVNGKALVISKYGLDDENYHTNNAYVTWETCSLRRWLNNEFIDSAFSSEEQKMISSVTVSADENPQYGYCTDPGNSTRDKVFLLSITEANKYFNSDSARRCVATDYAVAEGVFVYNYRCNWWLRTPGTKQSFAAIVDSFGDVEYSGDPNDTAHMTNNAVRPALWIDLNS